MAGRRAADGGRGLEGVDLAAEARNLPRDIARETAPDMAHSFVLTLIVLACLVIPAVLGYLFAGVTGLMVGLGLGVIVGTVLFVAALLTGASLARLWRSTKR